jgi:hypothetical protein
VSSADLTTMPTENATCGNCSAPLVADQRYCLSCGQPTSPVRLAFLDVLQSEHPQAGGAGSLQTVPVAYLTQPREPDVMPAWMRRCAPLFGVLAVLLLAMIIGLLVGHWATQSRAPSKQVVEVKGLGSAPLSASSDATPSTSGSSLAGAAATSGALSEAKELAKEEKTPAPPPPAPVKVSSSGLQKLGSTTGKKHQEEVAKLGNQPIETGGGGAGSGSSPSPPKEKSIGGGSGVTSIE